MDNETKEPVESTEGTSTVQTEGQKTEANTTIEIVSNGEKVEDTEDTSTEDATEAQGKEDTQKAYNDAQTSINNAKSILETKNIDYKALETEYLDKGGLSTESYAQLEKVGYPKEVVDAIITGWQAAADAYYNEVVSSVGGAEDFNNLKNFVVAQGEEAVQAFNTIMEQGNQYATKAYLKGIKNEMVNKYGTTNKALLGTTNQLGSTKGFANPSEMIKAINDRRYRTDAVYQREVERKIAASNFM